MGFTNQEKQERFRKKEYLKKVADKMGYIQNASASFLRSGKSKNIAAKIKNIKINTTPKQPPPP